jgi:hypothetical protein
VSKWEPTNAAGIIGLAAFQLVTVWNANAPSLEDVRQCAPGDTVVATRLKDADIMVGGLAVMLGTTYWVLTKDATAMVIMLGTWGSLSLWSHAVLRAAPAVF